LRTIIYPLISGIRSVDTVAGTGKIGYSGDGGLATSADLNQAQSIATDSSGNIYIADTYNNRIRMVTKSTGIITTVAGDTQWVYGGDGRPAQPATLRKPQGVAVDTVGNIYFTDVYSNSYNEYGSRVNMVMKSTGLITTVAGGGGEAYFMYFRDTVGKPAPVSVVLSGSEVLLSGD
jgi:trimeric autotransporter adhesin